MIKQYIKTNGRPALLHVNIAVRCGWVALYYKWVHHIPYIITEQHTVYLPEAKRYQRGVDLLSFIPVKLIFKNAAIITPVSETLGNALKQKFKVQRVQVIYNVVNTSFFFPLSKSEKNEKTIFLHISTLTRQKNPEQMLEAFALLKHQFHTDFLLWIVGPHRQHLRDLALLLSIDNNIVWHKETSQQNLALLMQKADASVLYSRFETFGCVNIEAMACGLPLIASDIPVFREYLQEGITAYFAESENATQLALVLHSFVKSLKASSHAISQHAQKFNYKTIGEQIKEVYNHVIKQSYGTQEEK